MTIHVRNVRSCAVKISRAMILVMNHLSVFPDLQTCGVSNSWTNLLGLYINENAVCLAKRHIKQMSERCFSLVPFYCCPTCNKNFSLMSFHLKIGQSRMSHLSVANHCQTTQLILSIDTRATLCALNRYPSRLVTEQIWNETQMDTTLNRCCFCKVNRR